MCARWLSRVRLPVLVAAVLLPTHAVPVWADELWVAPTAQQDVGGLGIASGGVWPVTPFGAVRFAWAVPNDLETFQSTKVVLIPHSPGGAANLNVFICPARNADAVLVACAGPFAQPFTGVPNQLLEVDISAIVASRVGTPGATYLAVLAYTTPTTASDHLVGLRFAYAPTAPSGVATLGANTFSGTQTAPAFVGDGSGLTNLPAPSGVATLGANVFGGTQIAPAFAGDGSGVTNVNANLLDGFDSSAFAAAGSGATLGANTFTSTQTIDGGNLDLDPSTGGTGVLTKNGVRFLHDFGTGNTFLGQNAANFSLTGFNNTAVGSEVLLNNTSGFSNTVVGRLAFFNNTSGDNNVAIGENAGSNATTGSNNIYIGANVFGAVGESNAIYVGNPGTQTKTVIAGIRGTAVTGGEPVVIDAAGRLGSGAVAPGMNTVGSTEVIDDALTASDLAPASVTTSELAAASVTADKVAFNYAGSPSPGGPATDLACVACVAASEVGFSFGTLGANIFTGPQTIDAGNLDLDSSTATSGNITKNGAWFMHDFGPFNTFLGALAGNLTMTGDHNAAFGSSALRLNTTGLENTAIGASALKNNTGGFLNTALGSDALVFNGAGNANTAIGSGALFANTTGSDNVALGRSAGGSATGSNNIYLGSAVLGVAGEQNTMYLGRVGTQTKTFIAGVRGITTVNSDAIPVVIDSLGQLGTVSSSRRFKEDIRDMADMSQRLFRLHPVTFRYTQAYRDGSKPIQFGLIAEEVAEVFPELAVRNANGEVETVHYETLNVLLLNELQKQRRELEMQREENQDQQERIESLERRLNTLLDQRPTAGVVSR